LSVTPPDDRRPGRRGDPRPDPRIAYRPADAAKAIGISRAYLYELIAAGRIRTCKLGAATLIERAELERFVAGLPEAAR
jgi:excisionase family DNA binding protein